MGAIAGNETDLLRARRELAGAIEEIKVYRLKIGHLNKELVLAKKMNAKLLEKFRQLLDVITLILKTK